MLGKVYFHQDGDDTRGGAGRRVTRYEQSDSRGQYPRPRDNPFAQQKPRAPVSVPLPPAQAAPQPREEEAQREVYLKGAAQYEQPQRPHVPGYMQTAYRQSAPLEPREFDMPPQGDFVNRHNPYVVVSEKNAAEKRAFSLRTLTILVIAAAVLLAGVWIAQLFFSAQVRSVYAARAAAEAAIAKNHPYPDGTRELIEREAGRNNLNPAFVAAIVLNESSFDPKAESYRGARGLMQMMEDTAQWVYDQIGQGGDYSFDLMYDAETNVQYGCWYLAYLSEKFGGDPVLVAAAFHSGQTNVLNWLSDMEYSDDQRTLPLDKMPDGNTKAYVEKVMNAFAAYRRLYYEEVAA